MDQRRNQIGKLDTFWTEWKWKLCIQKLWNAAKVVFRGKFIAGIADIRKEDKSQNNVHTFTLRK